MNTTVGSTQGKGKVRVQLLPVAGEIMLSAFGPTDEVAGAALDAHSAYVLGSALIRMSERIDAERGRSTTADCGIRCHGDLCAAGQLPCPSPVACGVAA